MQSIIIKGLIDLCPGLSLEIDLSRPTSDISETQNVGNKLAICLHPWSWLGGRMNDPWVFWLPLALKFLMNPQCTDVIMRAAVYKQVPRPSL